MPRCRALLEFLLVVEQVTVGLEPLVALAAGGELELGLADGPLGRHRAGCSATFRWIRSHRAMSVVQRIIVVTPKSGMVTRVPPGDAIVGLLLEEPGLAGADLEELDGPGAASG